MQEGLACGSPHAASRSALIALSCSTLVSVLFQRRRHFAFLGDAALEGGCIYDPQLQQRPTSLCRGTISVHEAPREEDEQAQPPHGELHWAFIAVCRS